MLITLMTQVVMAAAVPRALTGYAVVCSISICHVMMIMMTDATWAADMGWLG